MSKKDVLDYTEYIDQLTESEKAYIKKFYSEYYFTDIYNKKETLHDVTNKETKKELVKQTYSRQNDVFGASSPAKVQYENSPREQFMEEASDEWEWRDGFQKGGYELAVKYIFDQANKDIDNNVDRNATLLRFYIKMTKLRRLKDKGVK